MSKLDPPPMLKGESLKEWERCAAELDALGRLDKVDRAILTLHCQTWQLNREAFQHILAEGQTCEYANGSIGPTPHYKNWQETTKTLRGTLGDMGLTPKARRFATPDKPTESLEI